MALPKRRSRVHITMEVNDKGQIRQVELPFIVGVLGDFSMDSKIAPAPLRERSFTRVSKEGFDEVMKKVQPGVSGIKVRNKLDPGSNTVFAVEHLKFESMADFEPARIAAQIPELRELMEIRHRLKELATAADFSPEIEREIESILRSTDPEGRDNDAGAPAKPAKPGDNR